MAFLFIPPFPFGWPATSTTDSSWINPLKVTSLYPIPYVSLVVLSDLAAELRCAVKSSLRKLSFNFNTYTYRFFQTPVLLIRFLPSPNNSSPQTVFPCHSSVLTILLASRCGRFKSDYWLFTLTGVMSRKLVCPFAEKNLRFSPFIEVYVFSEL